MKKIFLIAAVITLFLSCDKEDNDSDGYAGYLFTSNNATAGNGIIALGRKSDGTLTELSGSPYATGHAGDAADGDFDTQLALRIVGDYLLAVNRYAALENRAGILF